LGGRGCFKAAPARCSARRKERLRCVPEAHDPAGVPALPVQCPHRVRSRRIGLVAGAVPAIPWLGAQDTMRVGTVNAEVLLEPVEVVLVGVDRIRIAGRREDHQLHLAVRRKATACEAEGAAGAKAALAAVAGRLEQRQVLAAEIDIDRVGAGDMHVCGSGVRVAGRARHLATPAAAGQHDERGSHDCDPA
jgi:hypothetical protein